MNQNIDAKEKNKAKTEQFCYKRLKPCAVSFILKILHHIMKTKIYLPRNFLK